jgi:hypothetical protein
MKRLILFPFFLIYELISTNITKSIFLVIAILTLYGSYNVDREMITTKSVHANDTITYKETSDARFALLVIFWIAVIFLVIAFFM